MNSGKRMRKLSPFTSSVGYDPLASGALLTQHASFEGPLSAYLARRNKQSNLKLLRRARGLTLEGLSELTGISPSYLSRLEGGARRLNTDLLERLSSVLSCQPGDLLNSSSQGRNLRVASQNSPLSGIGNPEAPSESMRLEPVAESTTPQKDLPVYGVSTPLGLMPGSSPESTTIDFTNPADWAFRPAQLLGIRTAFALYVRDAENAPKYMPGDILFVHPTRPLSLRCSVVVLTKDDHAIVRQFSGWGHDALLLSPFSMGEDTSPESIQSIPRENLRAVYKIIGTIEEH